MPQSFAQVWIHVVFSTKDRRPFLQNETFRAEMFRMLAYHVGQTECTSASVGGHLDHVHLLIGLSRRVSIAEFVQHIKTETSKWAKKAAGGTTGFQWQAGYGAFSVSHSLLDKVDDYIRDQAEHHKTMSYMDEFRRICEKHGIKIDERYVWD